MLTIEQYEQLLPQLSPKRQDILKLLYLHGPFKTTDVIAGYLGLKGYGETNLSIGTMGKYMSKVTGVEPVTFYMRNGKTLPAYFSLVYDKTSGKWDMVTNLRKAIENLQWNMNDDGVSTLETEVRQITRAMYKEGRVIQVWVNRYERDLKARKVAEKIHKRTCYGCQINFKKIYGDDVEDIIHYHHTRPLGDVKREDVKDVVKDLVPLCPNCHSVVHSTKELMSIGDLQSRVRKYRSSAS